MTSGDPGWDAVDALIDENLVQSDAILTGCLAASRQAGLPDISVSPAQGKFLQLLVAASGARRVLETGTLGGYSAIFLARGLPPAGKLVSLEANADYAAVARRNIDAAGLGDVVEVIDGPALETLSQLEGHFEFCFIDADKVNNCAYVDHAVRLSSPGAIVIVDNVVRAGEILDPQPDDNAAIGAHRLYAHVANHRQLDATALQTVGAKGWDGMLIARVCSQP